VSEPHFGKLGVTHDLCWHRLLESLVGRLCIRLNWTFLAIYM